MSKTIGVYQVGELIGKGNYGEVYKAVNTETGDLVAVKMIDRTRMTERLQNALVREIQVMTQIQSPYLVKLVDTKKTKRFYYLFLEFCYGGDLEQLIKRHGPVSEDIARRYLIELIMAIEALQSKKILHRDLKLANILLTSENPAEASIKIADFGFARFLTDSLAGTQCGSPLYMAPEIFENKPKYGHKADIWGIGTIIYEIVAGEPAFKCNNLKELLDLHERGFQPNKNLSMSPEICDLLCRMLDRKPSNRIDIAGIKAHPFIRPASEPVQDEEEVKGLKVVPEEQEPSESGSQINVPVPEEVITAAVKPEPEQKEPEPVVEKQSLIEHVEQEDDFSDFEIVDAIEESEEEKEEEVPNEPEPLAKLTKDTIEVEHALKTLMDMANAGEDYYKKSELVLAYALYFTVHSQLIRLHDKIKAVAEYSAVVEEVEKQVQITMERCETIQNSLKFKIVDIAESFMAIESSEDDTINNELLVAEARRLLADCESETEYVPKVEGWLQALQIAEIAYNNDPNNATCLELVEKLDDMLKDLTG